MRRRHRPAPPPIPPHLLVYDRRDWPVLDDDEARDAWHAARQDWVRENDVDVVWFLEQSLEARRAAMTR